MFSLIWFLSRVLHLKRTNFDATVWRHIVVDDVIVWRRHVDDDVTLILLEYVSFVGHQFKIGGWNKSTICF